MTFGEGIIWTSRLAENTRKISRRHTRLGDSKMLSLTLVYAILLSQDKDWFSFLRREIYGIRFFGGMHSIMGY
jgi:hypothetical protein